MSSEVQSSAREHSSGSTTPGPAGRGRMRDGAWLAGFCGARGAFAMVQTTYAGSLSLLTADWGMTASQAGLIASAFHVGFLFSLFAVGFLADRYGAKRTYLWGSVLAAASALLFAALARDFVSGLVLYGLVGLASGASYTPGLALLAQRFPATGRGRAIGFYIATASAGYGSSLFLSSVMIPLGGWQLAFWVTCLGPTAGMLLGAWMLRDMDNVVEPAPADRARQSVVGEVVRNKPALLVIGAYVFHSWELLALWAWIPYFLASAYGGGVETTTAASIGASFSAISYLVSMGGPISGGTLSDRLGRTAVIATLSGISVTCAFIIGWLVALPFAVVVAVALVFQFAAIGDSPVLSTALTEVVAPRFLGSAYALRSVVGFGAGAVSPWLFGVVLDAGRAAHAGSPALAWGPAFTVLGLGGLLAPVCTLWLRRLPEATRMAGGRR